MRFRLTLNRFIPIFLRKPQSTLNALARIVPLAEIEHIVLQTADRRLVLSELARHGEQSEQVLLGRVASVMGIGIVGSVSAIEIDDLTTIDRLRRAGAIPLMHGKMQTGIVCIDPELYLAHFPESRDEVFYLGLWKDIEAALDESRERIERRSRPTCIEGTATQAPQSRKSMQTVSPALLTKVLNFIRSQAMSFHSCRVNLVLTESNAWYGFETPEGKQAKGTLNPAVSKSLYQFLVKRDVSLGEVWSEAEDLHVEELAPEQLRLRWRHTNATPMAVDNNFPQEEAIEPQRMQSGPQALVQKSDDEVFSVLLVEDNQTFANVLERFFARQNIITDFASNGVIATEMLQDTRISPDLIVCDVHMPQMNGFEFVKLVKSNPKYQDIPIIMLTSDEDVETELRVLGFGADAFLAKSEDPRLLGVYVRKLIEKARKLHSLKKAA
ncbi:MAG: response regulator [Bdellovibrionales bacterium]|nr:response regulator [Bdellovibrionales bacterium]